MHIRTLLPEYQLTPYKSEEDQETDGNPHIVAMLFSLLIVNVQLFDY